MSARVARSFATAETGTRSSARPNGRKAPVPGAYDGVSDTCTCDSASDTLRGPAEPRPEAGRTIHPLALLGRAAGRGRGVRLDAGETTLLRRIPELSDAATQARFVAPGEERTEAVCAGQESVLSPARGGRRSRPP